jgi:hypothetical protein
MKEAYAGRMRCVGPYRLRASESSLPARHRLFANNGDARAPIAADCIVPLTLTRTHYGCDGFAPMRRSKQSMQEVIPVNEKEKWNRQVRRTAFLTVALAAALVFGIVVLASGDWIPGTVIVVASVVGLVREMPVIRKLCSTPAPGPPRSTQAR